jgi:large subunit ribosomal protein L6
MSRVGNKPIPVPEKVKVAISGSSVNVEGPKGKLSLEAHPMMQISQEGNEVIVKRPDDSRQARSLHGLTRALVNNMVVGVSEGYKKGLEVQGVGYRAEVKGDTLTMSLGFSHPVEFKLPAGIKATVDGKKTGITLEGIDKQLVGATAAKIRSFRKPEPYGGKGVRYADEYVRRKEGKSGAK